MAVTPRNLEIFALWIHIGVVNPLVIAEGEAIPRDQELQASLPTPHRMEKGNLVAVLLKC